MFSCAQRRDGKIGESEGERVGVSRRVVGAGVHLLMNPMNGVFVCVRERDKHSCGITERVDLLTKGVSVLAGGPGRGLMANCVLCGMVGVPVS